jgi:uncharacterized protein YegL
VIRREFMVRKYKVLLLSMLALMLFHSLSIAADPLEDLIPEKLAVSLIIDTSGSMADTDPGRLRETAANIFIDLLSPEDNLGIITFNTDTVEVLPMQAVMNTENKNLMKETLAPMLDAKGDTNYLAALEAASLQLNAFEEPGVKKVIIFLTDGVPDPDPSRKTDAAFMDDYMGRLWKAVSETALKKYPIYSVGFGAVDKEILTRISRDTQGDAKFINGPSELAVSFFNILSTLKNRGNFIETEYNLNGSQALEFDFDTYTSQVTMVFSNAVPGLDVTLEPPTGKQINSNVVVSKNTQYTLVTLNQTAEELSGRWKVVLKGNGLVSAFGDKDLFLTSWIVKPVLNSLHPLNEAMEIHVGILGDAPDDIVVEATIIKNGTPQLDTVTLTLYEGLYMGVYDKVDVPGLYEVDIKVRQNSDIITSTTSKVTVRELPVLKSDFYVENAVYKMGGNSIATAFLEMRGIRITSSKDLSISSFNLLLMHQDGTEKKIPLLDNGDFAYGDIKGADGLYSSKVNFDSLGTTKASLLVQGIYKGENFVMDSPLGNYEVLSPGNVSVRVDNGDLFAVAGNSVNVPLIFVNNSAQRETLTLAMDQQFGKIQTEKVVLEPGQTLERNILVMLNGDLENRRHEIPITASAEDPLTVVNNTDLAFHMDILTQSQMKSLNLKAKIPFYLSLFVVFLGVPMAIVLLGLVFYMLLVRPNSQVTGRLLYYKTGEKLMQGAVQEIPIKKLRKNRVVIAFDEENEDADFILDGTRNKSGVILTNHVERGKWKFIDGYRAFLGRNAPGRLMMRMIEPGIFMFSGEVYTKKELYDKDVFEIDGFTFQYYTDRKKAREKQQGKNVLEGRI